MHLSKSFPILILVMLLAACGGAPPTPGNVTAPPDSPTTQPETGGEGEAAPQVIATVNGEPISREAFERELARFEAGQLSLGLEPSSEQGYQQQILDLLIEQELIRQRADELGVSATEEEVNAEINGMIEENGEDAFYGWLNANYYTEEEFRRAIWLDLTTRKLIEQEVSTPPSESQQVNARHILVNSPERAEEVINRLDSGEDFGTLAAEYSIDVTTRDNEGNLGWFPRGGLLVPEVEETAFSLQPGQRSGVVESAWGYHIVETIEFTDAREVDPETQLRLRERAIEQWRNSLRENADIQQLVTLPIAANQ